MRRLIDISGSFLALLVTSPLLVAVAVAIAIDSPGNPFYLARRVGKDGAAFRMWKFRTMVPNAAQVGPAITGGRDPRITRLGHFLRRTKLDELPQFINVLTGDMSLVGPRPESPDIVARYTAEQHKVLSAKPGVTGKVQLESGEESDAIPANEDAEEFYIRHLMDRKLRADLEYLEHRTLASDVRILLNTAVYVMRAFTGTGRQRSQEVSTR